MYLGNNPKMLSAGYSGPFPIPPPLIRGHVVRGKTQTRKPSPVLGNRFEEVAEEFFGQLWVIPSPNRRHPYLVPPPPPSNPNSALPPLFWIRKDLFRSKKFTREDCFPVKFLTQFDPNPTSFRLSVEGIGHGSSSFAEVVKGAMEKGRPQQQRPPRVNLLRSQFRLKEGRLNLPLLLL
ncbi:hypothetical protein D1007_46331 [Hordeum vulgare]|nr:hypothetical protein D1007_46331 [Hordeum vulgare]